ncbi:hypothetical protein SODALDRAFT_163732 [Sodiomyces alkalinus F11]|uniref:Nonsense-mediated mRNA decay factor n=1 Tax=Sodiomyces alkalinus (strain CBS 110278 / VKM F-3762 / F11) TaxID=1314773 RepID=A0A3N2PVH0_SODAK|nr:hypothetical protein SODALDRAFT_163732 [Sodiomyces alkalinus F11]ROT38503.1 hypothetical protein SODALDRAFT_163732 [Sodiomyces alkalinus F11]
MAEQANAALQAENAPAAKHYWGKAQKCRKALLRELESLREDKNVSGLGRYEQLEKFIAEFRLGCVQTIFLNYEYSVKEGVEDTLWQAHSLVHAEYRNTLERVRSIPQLAVFKNKLEKSYLDFLKVSQRFYEGFVQRLATIYDVPELRLASKSIDSRELAEKNPVRDVSESTRQSLVLSCSMTLIHIGDLLRYRCQARHHKKRSYRSALTYYSLSHDLNPGSGHAHHQMAIVYLDEKKHFEIVYHFFMSLAVAQPHPRALRNLESELKSLLAASGASTSTSRRSGPPNIHEPFMNWFVRLHAFFHQGEKFSQQGELENEVLHRLDMSVRAPDTTAMLMKMVLVNIAAYYVAKSRLSGTGPAAKYTAMLLRFNVLFFRTLARALLNELKTLQEQRVEWDETNKNDDTSVATEGRPNSTPAQLRLLPLVRLYASWLVGHRSDVGAAAAEDTKLVVQEQGKTFAACLTLLVEAYASEALKIAPYLLPEDHMALGLLPLNSPALPDSCRLSYDQEKGREKPVCDLYTDKRSEGFADSVARVLDIMHCGYFLSGDPTLPFALDESNLEFTYQTESPVPQLVTTPRLENTNLNHTPKAQAARPGTRDEHRSPRAGRAGGPHTVPAAHEDLVSGGETAHEAALSPNRSLRSSSTGPVAQGFDSLPSGEALPRTTVSQDGMDYDFTENTAVMNMVHEFLTPPVARSNQPQGRSAQGREDTSYGMHSTTANEVFGTLPARNTPTLGSPSAFPGLPWGMVYTPTPNRSMAERSPSTSSAYMAAAAQNASRVNAASSDVSNRQGPAAPFFPAPSSTSQQYPQYTTAYSADDLLDAHRAQLLQAFGGRASRSRPTSRDYSASGHDPGRSSQAAPATGNQEELAPRHVLPESGYLASSTTSAFSHPSSLFQGTPYDGQVNPYGVPMHNAYQGAEYPSRGDALAYDATSTNGGYVNSYGGQVLPQASRDDNLQRQRTMHSIP